jgi:predicted dehydrogenase
VGSWAMSHATSRSDALFQVVGTDGMLVLDNLSRLSYHKPNGTAHAPIYRTRAHTRAHTTHATHPIVCDEQAKSR